ncbi:MAG: hypothetical protein GY943_20800, partial [Chloroflexi bacterium]|nr:hypothetical protein [Chloroflexota bacterium]
AIHLNHNLIAGNQAGAEGAEIKITSPDTIVAANNYNLFGHDGVNTSAAIDGFPPGSNDLIATSDGTDPAELGNILQPISKQAKLTPTHLLVPGSPAVDAIPADYAATDQHGISRPQGLAGDIGAVEVTFVDLTSIVENDVQTLKDNHEITKSQANRLRVFLIMASNQYQRGKITSAISWLNSFVDLVNDYIGQDILTTENGQSLIDDTEAILYQFTNQ